MLAHLPAVGVSVPCAVACPLSARGLRLPSSSFPELVASSTARATIDPRIQVFWRAANACEPARCSWACHRPASEAVPTKTRVAAERDALLPPTRSPRSVGVNSAAVEVHVAKGSDRLDRCRAEQLPGSSHRRSTDSAACRGPPIQIAQVIHARVGYYGEHIVYIGDGAAEAERLHGARNVGFKFTVVSVAWFHLWTLGGAYCVYERVLGEK